MADVNYNLESLLSSPNRDFLVRNTADQVKISELSGKIIALYFSASWCGPCRRFTPELIETYNQLSSQNDFEVVFVSGDHDEESFKGYFSKMPWLAIPFSDSDTCNRLNELFDVNTIPHLVILSGSGKVLTDEGVSIISEYAAEAYPFTPERIKELKQEEERAKKEQTLSSILASPSRNFVISKDGNQVPISELEGNIVGLYFYASVPCAEFTQKLLEVYHKVNECGESFKVVAISLERDEDAFKRSFEGMPWVALPCMDKKLSKLVSYFELSALPTLVIIGPDGKTIHPNVAELIEEHGAQGYPFTPEKLLELEEINKARLESQTLESILVEGDRDFVIGKDGTKVPVSELVGKNILLYFSAHWCPPCRAFLPKLIEAYHEIKTKDNAFEVIFISSDRDEVSFQEFFSSMPWLALPFGDERKRSLSSRFKIKGIPTLIALGPSGKTVAKDARKLLMDHGAKAYPFTAERLKEIEEGIEEVTKEASVEDGVKPNKDEEEHTEDGSDQVAKSDKDEEEDPEDGSDQVAKSEWVCDGEVCYKA
ncbi:Thioredoxin, nucleoredoxin [Thalictrum thalictroides]|uniref:protein-disulfide reductase n=1 Tax=Thalictrum thalictroides TaxID=46969 RepID=A0A7J6VBC1_THATH|nr:Thioredoxin, nucleoredoxin [Thalictrum thalictroides]